MPAAADITAWKSIDGFVTPQLNGDEYTTGMLSVLQRFMLVFLTEDNSPRYKFGQEVDQTCSFMLAWRGGFIESETAISATFMLCKDAIKQAMKAHETVEVPPDQRFKDVNLINIVIQPGIVQLDIEIKTLTETAVFKLPLPK